MQCNTVKYGPIYKHNRAHLFPGNTFAKRTEENKSQAAGALRAEALRARVSRLRHTDSQASTRESWTMAARRRAAQGCG